MNQPTYLPRLYLWNRFLKADVIIWLDDVGYQRVWQNSTAVKLNGRVHRLTVPALGSSNVLIKDVQITKLQRWPEKHLGTLHHAYGSFPYYFQILEAIGPVLKGGFTRLIDLNLALLNKFLDGLGFETEQHLSSSFALNSTSTQRLIDICQRVGASAYLCGASTIGDYLEVEKMAEAGIEVRLQGWKPPVYPQPGDSFETNLSIVDLVANVGFKAARELLK